MYYDDRTEPLLLTQAEKRGADHWNSEDALDVIATLLSTIDNLEQLRRDAQTQADRYSDLQTRYIRVLEERDDLKEVAQQFSVVALRSRELTCLACDEGFNYATGDWVHPMFNHNGKITEVLRAYDCLTKTHAAQKKLRQ